ncbi:EKC/KEOPS complex subunit GON7 [Lepisosteus oculatus]|uniref:Si:dkeyp-55f12.3 n=1 Tax=Lepisosteus oculatus TaxID=7918 RepID=W5N664_LEPOC
MAVCELRGDLKFRDGSTKEFVVKAENNLKSVLSGLQKIRTEVSDVLSDLVSQEKGVTVNSQADNGSLDDEGDEESDEEEEVEIKTKSKGVRVEPPAKRTKTLQA